MSNILRCLLPTAATNDLGSFGSHVSEVTVSATPKDITHAIKHEVALKQIKQIKSVIMLDKIQLKKYG